MGGTFELFNLFVLTRLSCLMVYQVSDFCILFSTMSMVRFLSRIQITCYPNFSSLITRCILSCLFHEKVHQKGQKMRWMKNFPLLQFLNSNDTVNLQDSAHNYLTHLNSLIVSWYDI